MGNTLSSLLTDGRSLDDVKRTRDLYTSITKEQLVEALKKTLVEERYFEIIAKRSSHQRMDEALDQILEACTPTTASTSS